jgi:hypothetical protein
MSTKWGLTRLVDGKRENVLYFGERWTCASRRDALDKASAYIDSDDVRLVKITTGERKKGWRPVTETPKVGDRILTCWKRCGDTGMAYSVWEEKYVFSPEATHWRLAPKPPKGDK